MDSNELMASITAMACALAKDKSYDEIKRLSTVFSQLSTTLSNMANINLYNKAIEEECEEKQNAETNTETPTSSPNTSESYPPSSDSVEQTANPNEQTSESSNAD